MTSTLPIRTAHRGAGPRFTPTTATYAVVDVRRVMIAAATLGALLVALVLLAFTPAGQRECVAVPVMSADVGHLAAQGWTVATGESMVAPGCADAAR